MIWDVVRDGRIASNGRHQLQSEHIQEKIGKKGGGKIQIFKSLYLHHFMNYRAILFCQGVYQFEQNQMAGLWALALGSKVGQGL